jgi:ribosomal protein L11 methyltransferase
MSSKKTTGKRFVWRKLSPAKWEDVWQERLSWLGQRLVIILLTGMRTLRIEAHQITKAEAEALTREFAGEVREAKPFTAKDLKPIPRPPLIIRGKLTVVGSEKDRKAAARRGVPCLVIPASLAFGTGEHATTATCLRMLSDIAKKLAPGWEALDLGTGSGILALAARLLGARRVEGADFDRMAIEVARKNAAANQVDGVVFRRFDVTKWTPSRKWPLVLANVYGPILIEAASRIASAVEAGGTLILSGILREQADAVTKAFRAEKIRFLRKVRKGKWVTFLTSKSGT